MNLRRRSTILKSSSYSHAPWRAGRSASLAPCSPEFERLAISEQLEAASAVWESYDPSQCALPLIRTRACPRGRCRAYFSLKRLAMRRSPLHPSRVKLGSIMLRCRLSADYRKSAVQQSYIKSGRYRIRTCDLFRVKEAL